MLHLTVAYTTLSCLLTLPKGFNTCKITSMKLNTLILDSSKTHVNTYRICIQIYNFSSKAKRNQKLHSNKQKKSWKNLLVGWWASFQLRDINGRHKRSHPTCKGINLQIPPKKKKARKKSSFTQFKLFIFWKTRNSIFHFFTSREMPSGFLWESFWGRDFFSWGIGNGVLGSPRMSFASIVISLPLSDKI